jgi:hypothetical protein
MFPPLLIPRNQAPHEALVKQTAGADPKRITIPPGVFQRPVPAAPVTVGIAPQSRVLQLRTRLGFSGPSPALGSAVWDAGGRTGPPITTFAGIPPTSNIRYTKTAAQFGGPAQTRVTAASRVKLWIGPTNPMLPCKHPVFGGMNSTCLAQLASSAPGPLAAAGGPVGFLRTSPGFVPMSPGVVFVSANSNGSIAMSASFLKAPLTTNKAASAGFPWTTGRITVSAPSAIGGAQAFTISGMDSRVNGIGTISLVSGALSVRKATGPQANRGWARLVLPEPGAVLGAASALAALAVVHCLARQRARGR